MDTENTLAKRNPQEGEFEIKPRIQRKKHYMLDYNNTQELDYFCQPGIDYRESEELHSLFTMNDINESNDVIEKHLSLGEKITYGIKGMCEAELVLMKDLMLPYIKLHSFWQKNGFVSPPFNIDNKTFSSRIVDKFSDFLKISFWFHSVRLQLYLLHFLV